MRLHQTLHADSFRIVARAFVGAYWLQQDGTGHAARVQKGVVWAGYNGML